MIFSTMQLSFTNFIFLLCVLVIISAFTPSDRVRVSKGVTDCHFDLSMEEKDKVFVNPFTGKGTEVKNDAFTRANRAARRAGATDRMVEIRQPLGMELDEDTEGNVYVKKLLAGGRAAKTGMVFEGDIVAMVSATFGDDMWSARGVGLERVVRSIQVRNTKPVKLVLEAKSEQLEKKRQAIAFKELSDAEREAKETKEKELLEAMQADDKKLRKKRKGFLGLW